MMYGAVVALLLTLIILAERSMWSKLLGLSSLSTKVAILSVLIAYEVHEEYLLDLTLMYLMASGAGIVLILIFLMRSRME